ncbi:hypothetical protein DPMN_010538 [Dreissena polymorpha]|uniref:Uncharacterized protein n=1 Tax=Dreissena polymorpha TaxID=45954 RepID=A0A9D4N4E1_DREPO|nr:hypothetical protein DPMN_010538 [Dreissena polymorpha]
MPVCLTFYISYQQTGIDRLESVQRSAARFITKDCRSRLPSCGADMLHKLDLPPLQDRRRVHGFTMLFKEVKGHVPAPLITIEHYLEPLRP